MNEDRIEIGELYESIYAGDAVYGDDDKDKDEKDTDTKDVDEKDTDSSDDSSDKDDKGSDDDSTSDSDSDSDDSDDSDSDSDDKGSDDEDDSDSDSDSDESDSDDDDSEDSDDGDSDGDSPKGDGSFSTDVDSLRKQYSELLANVFAEFAPDAIESALDGSDGPFGDNIQTIIQTAIDHLKGMIYDEFELEDTDLGIDPSAMGSFDPSAAVDVPMELELGNKPEDNAIDTPFDDEVGPELDLPTDSEDDEHKSGLEEGSKKTKKVSKLEECAKHFEPVNMRRTSRMSQVYNK